MEIEKNCKMESIFSQSLERKTTTTRKVINKNIIIIKYCISKWRREMHFSIFADACKKEWKECFGMYLLDAKLTSTWPMFPFPILLHISDLRSSCHFCALFSISIYFCNLHFRLLILLLLLLYLFVRFYLFTFHNILR